MNSTKRKFKSAKLWRNIAFLFGLFAFAFLVYDIGIATIWSNILQMKWFFVINILIWGVVYIINAYSWYIILQDDDQQHPVSFLRTLQLTISGYALNYITPFGLAGGEPYRIMELQRYMPTTRATSGVILYAMMHMVSHFFFWLIAAVVFAWVYPHSTLLSWILSGVVLFCVVLIALFFKGYKQGLVVNITNFLGKIPFLRRYVKKLSPDTIHKLTIVDQQITHLNGKRKRAFYFSLFLEFMARMVSCFEIYIIIRVLGESVTYLDAFIVVALSSLFANLLFFFPMQLGTREGGIYISLESLHLNPGISVSVSLITRIREAFWIAVGIIIMKIKK